MAFSGLIKSQRKATNEGGGERIGKKTGRERRG
jgi:hypothetical protein